MSSSGYLNGVPFAINPMFILKTNIGNTLDQAQDIIDYDLTNTYKILNYKYDYSHELKFLKIDKKLKKKLKQASCFVNEQHISDSSINCFSNQNLQLFEDTKKNLNTSSSMNRNNTIPTADKSNSTLTFIKKPICTNEVLEPTQLLEENHLENISQNNKVLRQDSDLFNPSSSLDPFNDMELKTINDMEELKTILTNHQFNQLHIPEQSKIPNTSLQQNDISANIITQKQISQCTLQDNFGLPKVSFIDLDINSNKL